VNKKLKILVIRFSSIGDIILTTPVIRCLSLQLSADIDFLTKSKHKDILITNVYLRNILTVSKNHIETIKILQSEEYDLIIDLQNNLHSMCLRLALGVKSYSYQKKTFRRYLLIYFGVDLLNDHVVDRYFQSVVKLGVFNDSKGIDYLVANSKDPQLNINQDYICWCIGGTYEQKKLSYSQIYNVVSKLKIPVLLLGGTEEKKISKKLIDNPQLKSVHDFCGNITIQESAYLIQKSKLLLTNDTGIMHIASAFKIPIICFWGCTKPSLGFEAYMTSNKLENLITPISKIPCSKHGRYCRKKSNGCIKSIRPQTIYEAILRLLK